MKKIFFIPVISGIFAVSAEAQAQRIQQDSYVNHMRTEVTTKIGEAHLYQTTKIKGEAISGNPFLSDEWAAGTVVLKDKRVYDNYKLKFNAYDQSVFFLSGNDSLEVADEVREFLITSPKEMHFINANEYEKSKNPLFYEVVIDGPKGHLLKSYEKVIATDNQALTDISTLKYFKVVNDYFYYDKKSGKVTAIQSSTGGIGSMLHLTPEQKENLRLSQYNFNDEKDIVSFFKTYIFNS